MDDNDSNSNHEDSGQDQQDTTKAPEVSTVNNRNLIDILLIM